MKKFLSVLFFCFVFAFGYYLATFNKASTLDQASQQIQIDIPKDLLQGSKDFLKFVSNPQGLTVNNCSPVLNFIYEDMMRVDPEHFDLQSVKANFKEIIRTLFLSRVALKSRLQEFTDNGQIVPGQDPEHSCVTAIRNINRTARFIEDYLGEAFLGVKPFDEKVDPKFYGTFTGDEPWLLLNPKYGKVRLRSGDVIISRGNAFTSAAIARIGVVDSQFSHVAFVYVDGDSSGREYSLEEAINMPNFFILEAHIEIGSTIRQIKHYFEDGNGRNVLFRYQDAKIAHQAAKWSFDYMKQYTEKSYAAFRRNPLNRVNPLTFNLPKEHPDFHVPYDFKMDTANTNEVFCSEVASMGFANKNLGITVPLFPTSITPAKENDLVAKLGITAKRTFAPGDLELDSRFEMLAEWRDYRKVRGLRYKDAILVAMYHWMKSHQYKFHPSLAVFGGANFYWFARYFDVPKISFNGKVIFDVTEKLPKNMTPKIAYTVETLNRAAEALEKHLAASEAVYNKKTGLLFSLTQMEKLLEDFRLADLKLWEARRATRFLEQFSPDRQEQYNQ